LAQVFKVKEFELISKRAIFIAIVMMLTGFIAIALDLGRLDRSYIPFLASQNFASPMMWMMLIYVLYFISTIFKFWFLIRRESAIKAQSASRFKSLFYTLLTLGRRTVSEESGRSDHRIAEIIGIGALILAIVATTNLGAVFGTIQARTLWFGAFMPIYFIVSAIVSGAAVLFFVTVITYKVTRKAITAKVSQAISTYSKFLTFIVITQLVIIAWKIIITAWGNAQANGSEALFLGRTFSPSFWGFELIIGSIIPILILLYPKTGKSMWGLSIASFMVILGSFAMRYDILFIGQIVPALEVTPGLYSLSMVEITITMSLVALAAFIYSIGRKIFTLSEEHFTLEIPD
jgi:molybdopterin-containing oxidoreductase family membrane subunit